LREEGISISLTLAGFHAGPISWLNGNLKMLVFAEGRKTGEKPSEQGKNQQTQPTYGTELASKLGHIGRR